MIPPFFCGNSCPLLSKVRLIYICPLSVGCCHISIPSFSSPVFQNIFILTSVSSVPLYFAWNSDYSESEVRKVPILQGGAWWLSQLWATTSTQRQCLANWSVPSRTFRDISCLENKIQANRKVGGFCALSGVFILTLPIPIVVNRFFWKSNNLKA